MVHKSKADYKAREIVKSLREVIPRQMYDVAIQAAIGGKILARETVKAFRKDVTAKLYGGDVTRKMKLLEKQKKGKETICPHTGFFWQNVDKINFVEQS